MTLVIFNEQGSYEHVYVCMCVLITRVPLKWVLISTHGMLTFAHGFEMSTHVFKSGLKCIGLLVGVVKGLYSRCFYVLLLLNSFLLKK